MLGDFNGWSVLLLVFADSPLQIRAVYQNNVRSEVGEGRDSMANVLSFATSIGT
jgi:hypothetical protein